jgi:hypothetical protein
VPRRGRSVAGIIVAPARAVAPGGLPDSEGLRSVQVYLDQVDESSGMDAEAGL